MEKRIFEEQPLDTAQPFQAKKEFEQDVVVLDEPQEVEAELIAENSLRPPRFWLRVFLGCLALLSVAVFAQSIQWLIDTWQAKQWIYFAFAIGFLGISLAGVGALINEWRKLVKLRKHHYQQQQSEQLLLDNQASGEKAVKFCKDILANMQNPQAMLGAQRWQAQLDEAYNSQEVLYLFGENVLTPIDKQVKQLISKHAAENAVIVAISPLAIADVLMVAWRNIALVNKITRAYGMELGYFSRLKLFKLVLTNMVFAGTTEIATELGSEFFAQNLTAKLSMRAAQGIGVGLLTARLGIKTMEFCRPIVFKNGERPRLSMVRQELLSVVKNVIFTKSAEKSGEKAH